MLHKRDQLISKAASSTDPDIRAAHARYEQAQAALFKLNSIEPPDEDDDE